VGFAAPRQSAFTLTQSPRIIAKIRQERNKFYQTELASTYLQTLKEVMRVSDCEELVGNDNHLTAYPTYFNFFIDALYNM
jgi:regulator of PEP synthase PpsR (kinase-PPPase family)